MQNDQSDNESFLVRYRNETYDLAKFVHKHPGGRNTLSAVLNSDIDHKFENIMPHSDAAKYLINEYKISNRSSSKSNSDPTDNNNDIQYDCANDVVDADAVPTENNRTKRTENVAGNNDGEKQLVNHLHNEACLRKGSVNDKCENIIKTDESMEYLVDWNRGMVAQISQLGANYTEWVNKPVDRHLRLFDRNSLEMLTKTPWWLVPAFWIPVIMGIAVVGIRDIDVETNNIKSYIVIRIILGMFLWTLLEYSLHRWVFHLDATHKNRFVCTFHFLLHGLHHKVPFDPYRLVFPPFPATILATLIYQPVSLLFENPKVVFAGGLIGYLCYDMIHYYIHHGSPSSGHFYFMKRYHYQHHFVHHDKGFGISSSIWDEAFGTKIILRKLRYLLKW